ncbi:MAG: VOC family protein [Myxococcota bacterium]|nr:VOC family protein [Myxococcota bacterium]
MEALKDGKLGLGPIDQVGYVVHDLNSSLPLYEALFGPFELMDAPLDGVLFRGKEISCHLKIAINTSGPVEVELIQVLEGETPHSEHLRRCGEGPHHVRFIVENLDAKEAELAQFGYRSIFRKRFGPHLAFAYVETPHALGPSLIELFENG